MQFIHSFVDPYNLQFVALPFGLYSITRVFTKILAPLLALLFSQGILTLGYLDNLLLRKQPQTQVLADNVDSSDFERVQFHLEPLEISFHHLEYVGLSYT